MSEQRYTDRTDSMIKDDHGDWVTYDSYLMIKSALNPSRWTRQQSNAWHRAIPDVQKAFEDLLKASI